MLCRDMALSTARLELVLLLILCIYGAKVVLVFVYVGDVSPTGGAIDGQIHLPDATQTRLKLERMRRHEAPLDAQELERANKIETAFRRDSDNVNNKIHNQSAYGHGTKNQNGSAVPGKPASGKDSGGGDSAFSGETLISRFDHGSEKCQEAFVVALVSSKPQDLDFRMAVRETWADAAVAHHLGVLTMFVLGSPGSDALRSSVFQENEKHDDILMGIFPEDPRKLTLKMLMGLNWVTSRCPSSRFVFTGDDHMFVIYERLVRLLRSLDKEESAGLWSGRISKGSKPERDPNSRYYVSEEQYPGDRYPDFCTVEAGYVFSMDAAKTIFSASWGEPFIPLPDVFTGVLAKKSGIHIREDKTFTYGSVANDVCELNRVITSRGLKSPDYMAIVWKNVTDPMFRRNCPDPDLNLVLGSHTNNLPYIEKTLQMRLDHPRACYKKDGTEDSIFILVLISSLPRHFELRRTIRETWGGEKEVLGEKIKLLFVMGRTQTDVDLMQRQVKEEDERYGDIVQAHFVESFQNLTLKVVMGLRWVATNCRHATYLYKGDDDMFVNFRHIVSYLRANRVKGPAMARYFLGSVLYRSVRVTRSNSKYYVPDTLYSGRYFPPYCSGGGYIISTDIIPEMYQTSLETAFIPIDDAYQGILASKLAVKPTDHKGFKNWGAKTDTCSLRDVMVVHGFKSPDVLNAAWKNYTMTDEDCPDNS